jgi:hypothetical protein
MEVAEERVLLRPEPKKTTLTHYHLMNVYSLQAKHEGINDTILTLFIGYTNESRRYCVVTHCTKSLEIHLQVI